MRRYKVNETLRHRTAKERCIWKQYTSLSVDAPLFGLTSPFRHREWSNENRILFFPVKGTEPKLHGVVRQAMPTTPSRVFIGSMSKSSQSGAWTYETRLHDTPG